MVHVTDVLAVSMMLGITAQVKEAGVAWDKGEKKSEELGAGCLLLDSRAGEAALGGRRGLCSECGPGAGGSQLQLGSWSPRKLLVPTLPRRRATAPSPGSPSAGLLVQVLVPLGWG